GKTINIDDVDESAIKAGTFNGQLYGLTIGANTMATVSNTRLVAASGETFDPVTWTFDDLKRLAVAITNSTPDGVYGPEDATAGWGASAAFGGQNGFTNQGTDDDKDFTFGGDFVVEYCNMWKAIRDAGGTPPGADSAGLAGQA